MLIKLYKNKSDSNMLHKNLEFAAEYDVTIKRDNEILNPTIILHAIAEDIAELNYAEIPMYNRFYNITGFTVMPTNMVEIELAVDVLQTYDSQIRNNISGTITRNQYERNGYIIDNQYTALGYKKIVAKTFPNGMTNDSIILMTTG